uniref:Uncharacterized protein n=1 Tax=Pristionchus pacificus TaxID=54126 RepID=A0A2A6CGF3_PRIPA|eukprot:PDM77176.1 hypothetical protein PRIPAC_43088 [Pristionchus pacificus]
MDERVKENEHHPNNANAFASRITVSESKWTILSKGVHGIMECIRDKNSEYPDPESILRKLRSVESKRSYEDISVMMRSGIDCREDMDGGKERHTNQSRNRDGNDENRRTTDLKQGKSSSF